MSLVCFSCVACRVSGLARRIVRTIMLKDVFAARLKSAVSPGTA